ncbi:unnamed protein product [Caenorhabditis auriculariae]|uniref:Uncharacterized protein n=1 Tax=Caenorhabditis auriculariae TaxID=2777116 RepID=A0A8S1H7J5_9PELO|nr:unnamed protein product [Caenorhabditis auriculariae]
MLATVIRATVLLMVVAVVAAMNLPQPEGFRRASPVKFMDFDAYRDFPKRAQPATLSSLIRNLPSRETFAMRPPLYVFDGRLYNVAP